MSILFLSKENFFGTAFLGLFWTAMLFFICLFFVVGIKACILLKRKRPQKTESVKAVKINRKRRTPIRSIEIDPDEIDKIYVKKSS